MPVMPWQLDPSDSVQALCPAMLHFGFGGAAETVRELDF